MEDLIVLAVIALPTIGTVFVVVWNKAAKKWRGDSIDKGDGTGYVW